MKNRDQVIRAIVTLSFYSLASMFRYWLLLCSAARQMMLHEDLKMVYRVLVRVGKAAVPVTPVGLVVVV